MNKVNTLIALVLLSAATTLGQSPPSNMRQSNSSSEPYKKQRPQEKESQPCLRNRNKTAEARYGDYVILTYRWPDPDGCLQILKHGRIVYARTSTDFKVGGNFYNDPGIPIGTDIVGKGVPNAVVGEWSGGAHCCFTLHVFELGENFRQVAKIEADHSDGARFIDFKNDAHYVFRGNDWAFAYWGTSFNYSPAPQIFLRYIDGRFRLATDLMKKPEQPAEAFAVVVNSVKHDPQWDLTNAGTCGEYEDCGIPVSLWKNMLEFLYTGHPDLAWRLLDEVWRKTPERERAFATAFCRQLSKSHYWNDLHQWIGPCPPKSH